MLSERESRFVAEFLGNGGRGKDAALAAGFPEASAKQRAHELRRRPEVAEAIAERGRVMAAELEVSHSELVREGLWYHQEAKEGRVPAAVGLRGLDLVARLVGGFAPTRHEVEERRLVVTMHLGGDG